MKVRGQLSSCFLLTIIANIAQLIFGRCSPLKSLVYEFTFQMVDTDTGEIICTLYKDFACNFATKNDAGFRTCIEWCMSAVRGVRTTDHKILNSYSFC